MFSKRSLIAFCAVLSLCYYVSYVRPSGTIFHGVIWYFVFYKLFMTWPTLLHKSLKGRFIYPMTKENMGCMLMAHRGGSYESPENTIQAFKHALSVGSQCLESDVRLTKDGVLIVAHDSTFERICPDKRLVREVNYADLPSFKKEMPVEFTQMTNGEYETQKLKSSDQQSFNTLEEFFQQIHKSVPITIDIKDNCDEAIEKTLELVRKYDRLSTTVLGNGSGEVQRKIKKLEPNAVLMFGEDDGLRMLLTWLTFTFPYARYDREMAALPYMTRHFIQMKEQERLEAKSALARAHLTFYIWMFQLHNMTFNQGIKNLNDRGIFTCYWVINQESEVYHVASSTPIMGIMTDRPNYIKPYLYKAGMEKKNQ